MNRLSLIFFYIFRKRTYAEVIQKGGLTILILMPFLIRTHSGYAYDLPVGLLCNLGDLVLLSIGFHVVGGWLSRKRDPLRMFHGIALGARAKIKLETSKKQEIQQEIQRKEQEREEIEKIFISDSTIMGRSNSELHIDPLFATGGGNASWCLPFDQQAAQTRIQVMRCGDETRPQCREEEILRVQRRHALATLLRRFQCGIDFL